MNFQNFDYDYSEHDRTSSCAYVDGDSSFAHGRITGPYPPQFWSPRTPSQQSQVTAIPYDATPTNRHHYLDYDNSSIQHTPSPQPTVVPYAPSPPNLISPRKAYGPERLFGPPLVGEYQAFGPFASHQPAVHFDEAQLAMDAAANAGRVGSYRDDSAIAAGTVTPGEDNTLFIQYALDALTREGGAPYAQSVPSGSSEEEDYGDNLVHDPDRGWLPSLAPLSPIAPLEPAFIADSARQNYAVPPAAEAERRKSSGLAAFDNRSPSLTSTDSGNVQNKPQRPSPDRTRWKAVPDPNYGYEDPHRKLYPVLDYKPWILRPLSMIILMKLCALMITALMFCAIYSNQHAGLLTFSTTYSGQYFLFRILPQLLAAVILLYAQGVITTCFRLLPFTQMADEIPRIRHNALFQDLYPKSFLWPHLTGPWQIKLCIFVTWTTNFTLPLQSAAFTVIFNDSSEWSWAAVQGVVWTLVALYFCLIGALIILMLYWHRRTTGVMWDVRSIADIVPMLNRSNTTADYAGTEILGTRREIQAVLRNRRIDKLGYWRVNDARLGLWYGIGVDGNQVNMPPHEIFRLTGKKTKHIASVSTFDQDMSPDYEHVRWQYLPWCMRNNQLIYFVVAGCILLIALFVVSFVQGTRLSAGFRPELSAQPGNGAFSPANFLYSFLPSLLGLILFLLFQALDQSIRILQPWAELSKHEGSRAKMSLLLDYAACLPFQSAWKAFRNHHFRAAFISLLSALFIFLPILAGGLFMALTVESTGQVRMFPNVPVFGALLGLLVLFLAGLVAMLPNRRHYRLPHAVTCLAEIISFCANDELTQDAAFRFPRSKLDLLTRLSVGRNVDDQPLWHFGYSPGRDETLGVRKLRRFTERKSRSAASYGSNARMDRVYNEKRTPQPAV
jgi:hypothetical protein